MYSGKPKEMGIFIPQAMAAIKNRALLQTTGYLHVYPTCLHHVVYTCSYPHRVLQSLIMEPESVHVVHQALEAIPLPLLEHLTEDPNQEVDIHSSSNFHISCNTICLGVLPLCM